MQTPSKMGFLVLGVSIFFGLSALGYLLGNALLEYKQLERSVNVKGLSEKEFEADIVIWPIQFLVASNDLEDLYESIDTNNQKIKEFLLQSNIKPEEITFGTPLITDKIANQYSSVEKPEFRYSAAQTVTVYSTNIKGVMEVKGTLSKLGKKGIAFTGENYEARTEYLFTRLNEVKPLMIEEATKEARAVAQKFASDSQSKLGKIKSASQGQFTITERDTNNPHIKKVRVVSTVEYYLND
jgi:hypothetical protein